MEKNKTKRVEDIPKKKRYKVDYVRVLFIITLVYFSVCFVRQQLSINDYNVKIESVNQDIDTANKKIEDLKSVKDKVNDASYIEKIAREECGLVKPYEKIFIDVNK